MTEWEPLLFVNVWIDCNRVGVGKEYFRAIFYYFIREINLMKFFAKLISRKKYYLALNLHEVCPIPNTKSALHIDHLEIV